MGQITALRQLAATMPVSVDDAVARFAGATSVIVARHLDTLAHLGQVLQLDGGRYTVVLVAA